MGNLFKSEVVVCVKTSRSLFTDYFLSDQRLLASNNFFWNLWRFKLCGGKNTASVVTYNSLQFNLLTISSPSKTNKQAKRKNKEKKNQDEEKINISRKLKQIISFLLGFNWNLRAFQQSLLKM